MVNVNLTEAELELLRNAIEAQKSALRQRWYSCSATEYDAVETLVCNELERINNLSDKLFGSR